MLPRGIAGFRRANADRHFCQGQQRRSSQRSRSISRCAVISRTMRTISLIIALLGLPPAVRTTMPALLAFRPETEFLFHSSGWQRNTRTAVREVFSRATASPQDSQIQLRHRASSTITPDGKASRMRLRADAHPFVFRQTQAESCITLFEFQRAARDFLHEVAGTSLPGGRRWRFEMRRTHPQVQASVS